MTISTADKVRSKKLEALARSAIKQYNDDLAKGGEPFFPDWAMDLLAMLDAFDRLAQALQNTGMHPVQVVDFENGAARLSIVKVAPGVAS